MREKVLKGCETERPSSEDLEDKVPVTIPMLQDDTDSSEPESRFIVTRRYSTSSGEISEHDEDDDTFWPAVEDDGSASDYKKAMEKTLKYLCQCDAPLCNIGDSGIFLRDLIRIRKLSCPLPTVSEASEMFFERYETFKLKFKEKLQAVDHVSLSCNTFKAVEGLLGMILHAHFIPRIESEKAPKPEKIFLGIQMVDGMLDKEEICIEIQRILNRFDLPLTKITSVCIDGSLLMKTVIEQLFGKGKSVPCLAITLHTVVNNALYDPNNVVLKRVLEELRMVSTYVAYNYEEFDSESLITENLPEEYDELEELVASSAPTKWNSVYIMVKDLLGLFPRLEELLPNSTDLENVPPTFFDPEFKVLLTDLDGLLSPFAAVTNEVYACGGVTGSIVIPVMNCLRSCLQSFTPFHDAAKILRKRLLVSLEVSIQEFSTVSILCTASFFDPRFKKSYLTPNIANNIIEECCAEVKLQSLPNLAVVAEEPGNPTELWKIHDENVGKQKNFAGQMPCEFQSYEQQAPLASNVDPFQCWWRNQTYVPTLTRTAMRNLTVCACSVPIEKFSDLVNGWYLRQINEGENFFWKYWHTVMERVFLSEVSDEHWEEVYGKV